MMIPCKSIFHFINSCGVSRDFSYKRVTLIQRKRYEWLIYTHDTPVILWCKFRRMTNPLSFSLFLPLSVPCKFFADAIKFFPSFFSAPSPSLSFVLMQKVRKKVQLKVAQRDDSRIMQSRSIGCDSVIEWLCNLKQYKLK